MSKDAGGYTSTYIGYMVPGGILLAILAAGVPIACFYTIWRNRWTLDDPQTAKAYGFLYSSYSRRMPYCTLMYPNFIAPLGVTSRHSHLHDFNPQGRLSR